MAMWEALTTAILSGGIPGHVPSGITSCAPQDWQVTQGRLSSTRTGGGGGDAALCIQRAHRKPVCAWLCPGWLYEPGAGPAAGVSAGGLLWYRTCTQPFSFGCVQLVLVYLRLRRMSDVMGCWIRLNL